MKGILQAMEMTFLLLVSSVDFDLTTYAYFVLFLFIHCSLDKGKLMREH